MPGEWVAWNYRKPVKTFVKKKQASIAVYSFVGEFISDSISLQSLV